MLHNSTHENKKGLSSTFGYVAYVRTPTFIGVRMILDMGTLTRTLNFPHHFLQFSNFLVLIISYCQKRTAIYLNFNVFICPWKRHILYCLHLFQRNLIF